MRIAWAAILFAGLALDAVALAQDHDTELHDHALAAPAPTVSSSPGDQAAPIQDGSDHAAMAHDDTIAPPSPTLLAGYGVGGFAVTTSVPQAQKFFSNGMELGSAFAHTAAISAMAEAMRLDPACAMCAWGHALVAGPTINYGKDAAERKPLLKDALLARRLSAKTGTTREKALIEALITRYTKDQNIVRRDRLYAEAMEHVAAQYPSDNEIAVLAADARLQAILSGAPDDPAASDRTKLEQDTRAVSTALETVLKRAPDHTPAIHFYIHSTEVDGRPALAEPYADRLEALAPNASHLVHMPSHTFFWVGRYVDAAQANRRAVEIGKANAARLGLGPPDGVWGLPYHSHNVIFGLGGALMAGDSRIALDLARPLIERTQATPMGKMGPAGQMLAASGYYALARFDPASALTLKEPLNPYLKAAWHYARGEAFAWQGDLASLDTERAAIPERIAQKPERSNRAAEQMLTITRSVLEGRAAMARQQWAVATKAFAHAAEVEETPSFRDFSDPPAFWYPVRRDLAEALLAGGDRAGAIREARATFKVRAKDPGATELLHRLGETP